MCNGALGTSEAERCRAIVDGLNGKCLALTEEDISLLPPIHSSFVGARFTVESAGYLFKGALAAIALDGQKCEPDEYTLSISGAPSPKVTLFGFAFMRHFTLYYDSQNRQVGLAKQKGCRGP